MSQLKVKLDMKSYFDGDLEASNGKLHFGARGERFLPYELLYGALGSCVHATFIGIADKMRQTYDAVEYEIEGKKREEVPTMLTDVWMKVTFTNASDQTKLTRAMNLATEYCSIFNTLRHVAQMHLQINFK